MTSSSKFEEAKRWVESLRPRWRLQVVSKKVRTDKHTGVRTDLPVRIRRFVEGVPWSLVQDSVDYLLSIAPYSDLEYNGVRVSGTYRPTITSWTRDDKDSTVSPTSAKYNDSTYTLVQDLIEDGITDSYGTSTGGSCSEEVVTEWHWDESGVAPVPEARQGVSYSVQAVSRKDDGTFDYALVKRTAVTQHMSENKVSDDAISEVTEETWDNVYGTPGAFVGSEGIPVSVPTAGTSDGTKTEVKVATNQDCTYRISVVRTTSKKDVAHGRSTETTLFSEKETDVTKGASSPLPDAPRAGDGMTYRNESQLQEDGTYVTNETVEEELPVEDVVIEESVTRKGRRRTITSQNMEVPASTDGIEDGGSVRNEKTPGGRYRTTVSTWVRNLKKVGEICSIDLFSHRHVNEVSGEGELGTGEAHVDGSGKDGKVITKTVRMDDDGSVSTVTETVTEKKVENARESWTVGLFGVRHRVEDRNVTSAKTAPKSVSAADVGTVITNERTPGGLYNTTVESLDRNTKDLTVGEECEKTIFEHTDVKTKRGPASSSDRLHSVDPGSGKRYSVSSVLNEDGSATVRNTTVEEKPVTNAKKSIRKVRRGTVTSRTDRSVDTVAADGGSAGTIKIGETREHVKTPGGKYDYTETTVSVEKGQVDSGYARRTALVNVHDKVTMSVGTSAEVDSYNDWATGTIETTTKDIDDYGIIRQVVRSEKERTGVTLSEQYERVLRGIVKTKTERQETGTGGFGYSSYPKAEDVNIGEMHSRRATDAGNVDVTDRTIETSDKVVDSYYWKQDAFSTTEDNVKCDTEACTKGKDPGQAGKPGIILTEIQDVDQYGFRKTVKRTETFNTGVVQKTVSSDALSYTTVNQELKNLGDSPFGQITAEGLKDPTGSNGATPSNSKPVLSKTYVKTPSGLVEVRDDTVKAGRKIEAVIGYDIETQKSKVAVFANATASDVENMISVVKASIAKDPKSVGSTSVYPTRGNINASVSINRFGLLDGSVSMTYTYPPSVMSYMLKGDDTVISFTVTDKRASPVFSSTYDSDGTITGTKVRTQIETITRNCQLVSGYGYSNLQGRLASPVCPGTSVHYNPEDGTWSGIIVTSETQEFDWTTKEMKTFSW